MESSAHISRTFKNQSLLHYVMDYDSIWQCEDSNHAVRIIDTELTYPRREYASPITNPGLAAELFHSIFGTKDSAYCGALYLNIQNQPAYYKTIAIGSLTEALVHPREVYQPALLTNSAALLVAHNHPSGNPTPSNTDLRLEERLREGGDILGIELLDFLIVTPQGEYWSIEMDGA